MKLVVGFLTYNEASAKYLADFLPSLQRAVSYFHKNDYKVLVFDNSDQGNSLNKTKISDFNRANPDFLEYISTDSNLGFSRAYNILIREAVNCQAEYFFVINPDTVLEKDVLKNLVETLDQNKDLVSASPKIRRWDFAANTKTKIIDSCGLILRPGLRFRDLGQGAKDEKQFDQKKIIGPSGAAGLFRLSALSNICENGQYFDELFFMYKEDCDLAYRLNLKGGRSVLVPTAIVYHDRTVAVSKANKLMRLTDRRLRSRQARSWSFVNQHLIFIKHWTKQSIFSKFIVLSQVFLLAVISLTLEQFLLKDYKQIKKLRKVLTDIK